MRAMTQEEIEDYLEVERSAYFRPSDFSTWFIDEETETIVGFGSLNYFAVLTDKRVTVYHGPSFLDRDTLLKAAVVGENTLEHLGCRDISDLGIVPRE